MALKKCRECGHQVSTKAETCPSCGASQKRKPMGCGALLLILFLGAFVIPQFIPRYNTSTETPTAKQKSSSTASNKSTPAPAPKPGDQWDYFSSLDDMSSGRVHTAIVSSVNTVNLDFPYQGAQHATLKLRTHPRWGKDVIFRIERGQLLCNSYDGCSVLVRFDDGQAVEYTANEPSDNSTEVLFIANYSQFVGNMLKAKVVRISPRIYQNGNPIFRFDVSGFSTEKYLAKK